MKKLLPLIMAGMLLAACGPDPDAAAAQQTLIANYPDSSKVPDAMIILSNAQSALGDNAAAKKTLEEVVRRFPQSNAADKARQRLARLR